MPFRYSGRKNSTRNLFFLIVFAFILIFYFVHLGYLQYAIPQHESADEFYKHFESGRRSESLKINGSIYSRKGYFSHVVMTNRSLDKEAYLDSLEWKNFTADRNFMRDHCGNELNVGRWTPASSSATKICLLPLAEDRFVSQSVKVYGNWEVDIQRHLFMNVIPKHPQAAFVDIGGHLGTFSLSAAKMGREVFTFEPSPKTFQFLSASVQVNSLQSTMHLYPVALLDKRHKCAKSRVNPTNLGGSPVIVGFKCDSESSPVATLDDLLPVFERRGLTEAIIKIDCEGSEPSVFIGGEKFLTQISVPFVQMEFSGLKRMLDNRKTERFFRLMHRLNYVPTVVGANKLHNLLKTDYKDWPDDINWIKT